MKLSKGLHNEISRLTAIPHDCFKLIFDGDIMDPAAIVSQCGVRASEHPSRVALVKTSEELEGKVSQAKQCILCWKTFRFWTQELLCQACWIELVRAEREYGDRPAEDSESD